MPSRSSIWLTSRVASLSDIPFARLNDTVTDGNSPVWFTCKGVVLVCAVVMVASGLIALIPVPPR